MDGILDFIRSVPDSPQGLLDFIAGLLLEYGYVVIFLGSALDNFGLPSSGDIVMFAGGFFANGGQSFLPLVMLLGFLGATVSDNAVYWIGRVGGRPLITRILNVRLLSFLPYSLAATTTWALLAATVGYVFGEYWNELLAVARSVGYGFVILVVLLVALYVYRRRQARKKAPDEEPNGR